MQLFTKKLSILEYNSGKTYQLLFKTFFDIVKKKRDIPNKKYMRYQN